MIVADDVYSLAAAELKAASSMALPANDAVYRLREGLFPAQLRVLDDTRRLVPVRCPRRVGKTHVFAAKLLTVAVSKDNALCLYLTITRLNAKRIIWKILKRLAWAAGIAFLANESELTLTLANGSIVMLGGADDTAEIEKWRGNAYDVVIVDECGSFPLELFASLRDDVVEPATMDSRGQQLYGGTPGGLLDGAWYEMSANDAEYVHHWTARENTAVPWLWDEFLALKARRGWDDQHPSWVVEYLGLWFANASKPVYPYDDARNGIDGLPTHTVTNVPLHPSGWRYVLGVDVGFVHSTAFALGAAHELDPRVFVISTEQHKEMLPDQVIAHIRQHYLSVAPWLQIVVDAGGMGKIHERTMSLRGSMSVKAAEKREKPDAVRDLRGQLLSGQAKVLRGPQNDALRSCYATLGWDDKHEAHSKEQEDDVADAVLYMVRELYNYRAHPPELPSEPTAADRAAKIKRDHFKRYAPQANPWAVGEW